MRAALLAVAVLLCGCVALPPAQINDTTDINLYARVRPVLFKLTYPLVDEEGLKLHYGTGFCMPNSSRVIMTVAHVAGPDKADLTVTDWQGKTHETAMISRDEKLDLAMLYLSDDADRVCASSGILWADRDPSPGQLVAMLGWGAGKERPLYTKGVISSEKEMEPTAPFWIAVQLNALGGHSGSPVLTPDGYVVGIMDAIMESGDQMDVMVPVSVMKKFLK